MGVPPTPNAPVPSYYRYPPPRQNLWLYYNGETWVGEPRTLPWYRKPLTWARGRAPIYQVVFVCCVTIVAVVIYFVSR